MFRHFICLTILLPVSSLNAQEIISVEEVQPHTRIFVKQANGSVTVMPAEHLIMPGSMYSHESLQFLTNPKLLEDATLSDAQTAQLKRMREDYQEKSKRLAEDFKKAIEKAKDKTARIELAKELFEDIRSLQQNAANKIETELIPFQASLIKKHKFKQLSYLGFYRAILKEPFNSDLKLSKKQKEEVNKIAKETDKEIAELIAEARERAKKKTLKLLDSDQRKYIENLGDQNK